MDNATHSAHSHFLQPLKETAEGRREGLYYPIKISNFFQPILAISPSKLGGILEQQFRKRGKRRHLAVTHPPPFPPFRFLDPPPRLAFRFSLPSRFPSLLKIIPSLAAGLLTLIRSLPSRNRALLPRCFSLPSTLVISFTARNDALRVAASCRRWQAENCEAILPPRFFHRSINYGNCANTMS